MIVCAIVKPILIRYLAYFCYPIFCSLLPILITSSFSLLAYRNVHHIVKLQVPIVRRRLNQQLTTMVLIRVAFFIICKNTICHLLYLFT